MLKQKLSKFVSGLFALIFLFPIISNNVTYAQPQKKILNTQISTENNKIAVDFAFSIGNDCACAKYLRDHNLRYLSSPLDWMFDYSLKTVNHLFKTEFKDFFKQIKVNSKKVLNSYIYVYDTKNHIESHNHYRKNVPFKKERERVDGMMKKRINCTLNEIKKAKSIAIISHRNNSEEEFIEFIKEFSKTYPNKKIYLINVKNGESETPEKKIIYNKDNLIIIEYKFLNNGKKYPQWYGNPNGWAEVMETIKLKEYHKPLVPKQFHD